VSEKKVGLLESFKAFLMRGKDELVAQRRPS